MPRKSKYAIPDEKKELRLNLIGTYSAFYMLAYCFIVRNIWQPSIPVLKPKPSTFSGKP